MKSFSSSSFANENAAVLELAAKAVNKDPQALFTDFQWFLYAGKDTVFFTAFSRDVVDKTRLTQIVAEMVSLAPQLTHGYRGAKPGQPFSQATLEAITSVQEVDSFEGYPDKWLSKSEDIYDYPDLPLFRVEAVVRRGGPDAQGRATLIQVRSAHAVLEGSDSALLTRSQSASHGIMSDKSKKVSFGARFKGARGAAIAASIHLFFAHILSPKEKPFGFKTLALERHRLRRLATRLGVRQRSLYFALVTYALNGEGTNKRLNNEVITAAYTMLDTKRNDADDDFFRVRALMAKFPVHEDFVAYVRGIDKIVEGIEQRDITQFQIRVNAMFSLHRKIHRVFPFLYGPRFWRFSGRTDLVLTLVPPHRTYGPLTQNLVEPIYCGAYHAATNICTFCPGRQFITLNFAMDQKHIAQVDRILPVLEKIEAMEITPLAVPAPVEEPETV